MEGAALEAKRRELESKRQAAAGPSRGNFYYRVVVKDNGSGMPHKDIPNMLGRVLSGAGGLGWLR
jgi:DNA topoisomerase-6 subunit B